MKKKREKNEDMGWQQPKRILFYSYASNSPDDQMLQEKLSNFLSQLIRDEHLYEWSDRQVLAGEDRSRERRQALESAPFVLLLLSASYLASDTYYQEMQEVLERHQQGNVHAIPILLSPCDWRKAPVGSLFPLPRDQQPVTKWAENSQAQAFLEIAQEIRRIVETYPSRANQASLPLSSFRPSIPAQVLIPSALTKLPQMPSSMDISGLSKMQV